MDLELGQLDLLKKHSSNKEPHDSSKVVKIQVCKIYLESKTSDKKVT